MEKPNRSHLNEVIKVSIINNKTWRQHVLLEVGGGITAVVFLPKMPNLSLIMRNHQTKPNEETPYKNTDQSSSRITWS